MTKGAGSRSFFNSQSANLDFQSLLSRNYAPSNEVHEGRWQGHYQGFNDQGPCNRAWPEAEDLLRGCQQPRCCRHSGGQEKRCLHHSRTLPPQDSYKASQDNCQGIPSGCIEEADLSWLSNNFHNLMTQRHVSVGIPWSCLGIMRSALDFS